jgi:aromatic ring-opening dioxygenase catalytic subunit (LigB family)
MSDDPSQGKLTRRDALTAVVAGAVGCKAKEAVVNQPSARMPTVYIPHGGGPWPFVDMGIPRDEHSAMAEYLASIPGQLPAKPKAMLVISAHWEERVPTVMTSPKPPIFYDYYGFPEASYRIPWPAPGEPKLAARVRSLLEGAGMKTAEDAQRGFDHGTFIPLKLTFPNADVPTIQLSLQEGLDPARHIAIGKALAPLRDEGVLIVGSGMSYHDLRSFRSGRGREVAAVFDEWLKRIAVGEQAARDADLLRWASAPAARDAHPREEHLLPLMVIAGAAGADRGRIAFNGTFMGARISGVHFS